MTALAKNVLIGIFVLIAFAIILFILLFLHPAVGDNAKTLHVRFTDIDKVNIGTRVTYAGKPVGEVVEIREIPEARTERVERNGHIYVYELALKVDSGVNVYDTDEIAVKTSGLLGERNIAITPLPLKPGETLYLINNETIYATESPSVEETLKQFGDLSRRFNSVLGGVNDIIEEIKREEVIPNLAKTVQNVTDITDALNQPEKWDQTLTNLWTLSERVNHSWTTVDHSIQNIYSLTEKAHGTLAHIDESFQVLGHSFQNFDQLTIRAHGSWTTIDDTLQHLHAASVNTDQFTDQIKQVINYAASGQGTIGHLFVGNDLYLRLKSIFHKGQVVMDDINRFGILFHLSKDWQRLNARRLKLLQHLSTPHQFTQYFNRKVDEISTSLSSVSMLLKDSACYPQSLLNNTEFTQRFSLLLKKVEGMEDSLKMYNEQIVDQENFQE